MLPSALIECQQLKITPISSQTLNATHPSKKLHPGPRCQKKKNSLTTCFCHRRNTTELNTRDCHSFTRTPGNKKQINKKQCTHLLSHSIVGKLHPLQSDTQPKQKLSSPVLHSILAGHAVAFAVKRSNLFSSHLPMLTLPILPDL